MTSNNKKDNVNKTKKQKKIKQAQQNKTNQKLSAAEHAKLDDMNQIDWFPFDPYCD